MCFFGLIGSAIGLFLPKTWELMARSPIPVPLQIVMMYVGLTVSLVSAVGMLMGKNWARLLYVAWAAAGFLIRLATAASVSVLPGLVIYLVIVFFLFRPNANRYFKGKEAAVGTTGQ